MQRRSGRSFVTLASVLGAAIFAACTSGITGGPALVSLLLFSGSGQSGPIGTTLPQPLIVRVEDQDGGQPVAGVVVNWQVTAGGGSVDPGQSVTDGSGQASTSWRLGGALGAGTVTASLGSATVVFTSTAITAPVAILVPASGNAQVGTVGTQLGQPVVVRATDAAGNPKAGVLVSFTVVSPGGTLSAPSGVTDAAGLAGVQWTLGGTVGTQTMIASTSGVAPLTLTASAIAGAPTTQP